MGIDAGTRRRLTLGLVSSYVSRFAGILMQLVQVPVFLHFWSPALFGEWMILASVPNYLSFSHIGFGNVAGNEMMMAEARGDRATALAAFQSCWWLMLSIFAAVGVLLGAAVWLLPVTTLLNVHHISESDTRQIVMLLGLSLLLGQVETLLQSAYKAIGRYAFGSWVDTTLTLLAFAATLVPVAMGRGPLAVAVVFAVGQALGTVILMALVLRDIPWLRFGWSHASLREIRRQAPFALAFMGFPLGQSLNLQGTLLAVTYALGPVAVVVFSTARTVSRVALQMVQTINYTFEPEFSRSFAQGNAGLVRALHRRACQMALWMAVAIVLGTVAIGPWLLTHWTAGKVPPSRGLLALLLAVVVLYSLWSTSSSLLTATNQHRRVAGIFLVASGATVVLTFVLARRFGLYGAAASLLVTELVMNGYVLPTALRIAQDDWGGFVMGLLQVPRQRR